MSHPVPDETPASTPFDALVDPRSLAAIVWSGRRLVAGSVVVALVLAAGYLLTAVRLYQASAKLLVIEHGGVSLDAAAGGASRLVDGVEDSIPTHMALVSSPVVLRRAVEAIGLNNLPSLGPPASVEAAARQITDGLSVARPDRQAKILQIGYRCGSPDEAVRVVRAVVDSYQAFLEEVYARGNNEVVSLMSKAREDLNNELKELEQRYLEFHEKSPQIVADGAGRTFAAQRIDEWNKASREATLRAVHLKTQLELGRELARSGVGLWSIAYAMDQVAGAGSNGGGLAARAQSYGPAPPTDYLRQLATEQQKMAEALGPQSTKVREIQEQIAQAQANSRSTRGQIERAEIDDLLGSVGKSLASISAMREEIQKKLEADLVVAKQAEIDQLTEANLKNELERHRTLFSTVVGQLKQARLVGNFAGTRAQVVEPPNVLPRPVQPRTSLTGTLALAAGLFTGLALAVGVELITPRVRSAAEMRRVLGIPILGQVPHLADADRLAPGAMGRLCQERPRSPAAESYRVIRANLDLSRRMADARVVLVTSPHDLAGCSSVASNLAVAWAQAGRKVALVDADLRTPSLHEFFGLGRERGLVHLLRELQPMSRVAQPTRVPGLDLVASGPDVPHTAELLSSSALPGVLEGLRRSYDLVVIDAPALLNFTDSAILAAAADAVVLVVRLATTRRADATRAVETLLDLGAPVLGAVINDAAPEPRGGLPRFRGEAEGAGGPDPAESRAAVVIPHDPQVNFGRGSASGSTWGFSPGSPNGMAFPGQAMPGGVR